MTPVSEAPFTFCLLPTLGHVKTLASSQDELTGPGFTLPSENKLKKTHRKQRVSRPRTSAHEGQWSQMTRQAHEVSPTAAPAYCSAGHSGPWHREGVPWQTPPESWRWGWASRRPRKPQACRAYTRPERVAYKKSYRDSRRVILRYLPESLSAHAHEKMT